MYYTALIGNPTKHSVSHVMYEELVKAAGLHHPYKHIKVDVDKKDLKQALDAFKFLEFAGLNVTLPHKLAVIPEVDDIDAVVKDLGAVNTIKFGNITTGHNTDWLGVYNPIIETGRVIETVTIFGSGGAARAAIYAAKKLGAVKIYVHYRTEKNDDKTEDLKNRSEELGITLLKYSEIQKSTKESELIINATSAGMIGKDKTPFGIESIADIDMSQKIYFDVVFNPIDTPLLNYFRQNGAYTIDGLWMMIYQGIAALEIWLDTNITVQKEDLQKIHALLIKELQNV